MNKPQGEIMSNKELTSLLHDMEDWLWNEVVIPEKYVSLIYRSADRVESLEKKLNESEDKIRIFGDSLLKAVNLFKASCGEF